MLREALRRYGIEDARPRRVRAGNNNEHWFCGKYVLRRYRERRPADTIAFEHAIVDHLAGLGWPVAAPVATPEGERVVDIDGRAYALFPRLPGRRGVAERPRRPGELGRMLARLHHALASFRYAAPKTVFAPILEIATTWGTGTHTVEELLASYAGESPDPAAYCLDCLQRIRTEVAAVDSASMVRTLIHGDWHAGNLLYSRGQVTGVLDFDFAHPDLRVADLAVSATVVDDDAAFELIRGYLQVQSLPDNEMALLNLHERARLLGAVAATLSIRLRGGRTNTTLEFLVEMLRRLEGRWPAMRLRLGLG